MSEQDYTATVFPPFDSPGPESSTSSLITDSLSYLTAGPARTGYVLVSLIVNNELSYSGVINENYDLSIAGSPLSVTCNNGRAGCNSSNGIGRLVPTEIGTVVTLHASATLNAAAGGSGPGTNVLFTSDVFDTTFGFQFFEADGTTRVAVSEVNPVPESGTCSLFVIAAVLLFGTRYACGFMDRAANSVVIRRTSW